MAAYACLTASPGAVDPAFPDEAAAIAATGRAMRRGPTLQIGRVRIDDVPWSAKSYGYQYLYGGRFAGLAIDVVRVIGDEYEGVLLVDTANGDRVEADALPVPSPDGEAFVNLFGFDEPKPGVKVYERRRRGWRTYTLPATLPCAAHWIGPRRFQFTEQIGPWNAPIMRTVTVSRGDQGWRRDPPAWPGH